jgi:hypothetical protein
MEVMFMETEGDRWYFRREPEVGGLLTDIGFKTADDIPCLVPEIQLLFKAGDPNAEKTRLDFNAALPLMNEIQKDWLISALKKCYNKQHPWISRLE